MSLLEQQETVSHVEAPAEHSAPSHVAHHFKTYEQQYNAAKLGMWVFLVTEILLFSGLFALYGLLRATKPEIFAWGHRMLDKELGLANTIILITSSFTMALAVRAAQLRQRRMLVGMLCLTFLCGVGFMGIKSVEYSDKFHFGLLPGEHFKPNMKYVAVKFGTSRHDLREMMNAHGPIPKGLEAGSAERGAAIFAATCAACHAADGAGIPNMGADLRTSRFIAASNDQDLLKFVQRGRMPADPDSVMKLAMPARGGNPSLNDQKLYDTVTYIRTLQKGQHIELGDAPRLVSLPPAEVPQSENPAGVMAPEGLRTAEVHQPPATLSDFEPPPYQALFFSTYFLITGLHGIHVLAGMLVIAWLIVKAYRGKLTTGHHTPVEIGGLYWHLVDLVWILVFALIYMA